MTASKSSETAPDATLFQWLREKGMKECLVEVRDIPGRGRGLTVTQRVASGASLFTIPNSALLNLKTLHSQYSSLFEVKTKLKKGLTAPQLLALHLFVYRQPSTDSVFGPYIDSLPRDFDAHPLAWRVRSAADPMARDLLEALPQSVLRVVEAVHTRFLDDWRIVSRVVERLRQQGHLLGTRLYQLQNNDDQLQAFLWAWLCVNTRSIYYKISSSPKSSENITLCPLLDFANHPSDEMSNSGSSVPTFHAPTALQPGDEVFLNYGPHPDMTLFAEYGFVTGVDARAQLDLGPELEPLLGNDAVKRAELERAGYWGDWTLHLTPTPHPSFRTMTALRLIHVKPSGEHPADLESSPDFRRWLDTLTGLAAVVSDDNEAEVRTTLEGICSTVLRDAPSSCQPLRIPDSAPKWAAGAQAIVHALLEERRRVAQGVLEACRCGDEF